MPMPVAASQHRAGPPAGCRCRCCAGWAAARRATRATIAVRAPMPPTKRQRDQEAEEGQAGDRLREAGDGQHRRAPAAARRVMAMPSGRPTATATRGRGQHEHEVLRGEGQQLGAGARRGRRGSPLTGAPRATKSRTKPALRARRGSRAGVPLLDARGRASITATSSARRSASGTSWVTSTTVLPSRACSSRNSSCSAPARQRVEGAERLVHQQQRRIGGQGARQAHALALAAGELARDARPRSGPGSSRTRRSSSRARAAAPLRGPAEQARHERDVVARRSGGAAGPPSWIT